MFKSKHQKLISYRLRNRFPENLDLAEHNLENLMKQATKTIET